MPQQPAMGNPNLSAMEFGDVLEPEIEGDIQGDIDMSSPSTEDPGEYEV